MKQPYFSTPERIAALRAEVGRWIGTPFAAHANICGAGVDCVQFAAAVFLKLGIIKSFEPGRYTLDGGLHSKTSALVTWFETSVDFMAIDPATAVAGDILCFASTKYARPAIAHHAAISLGNRGFAHAMPRYGVQYRSLSDPVWTRLLTCAFRPVEEVL